MSIIFGILQLDHERYQDGEHKNKRDHFCH